MTQKKEERPKQKFFASYIFMEDSIGIPFELFAHENPNERWQNDLRWTSAVSVDEARNNIRAKIKYKLGYTWAEVQRIGMKFGPAKKEDYMSTFSNKDAKPTVDLWTSRKDKINVIADSYTVVKEDTSLFPLSIPIMDTSLEKFVEHYLCHNDNWCLVDDKGTPLCAFAFRENAETLGKIVDRAVKRLYLDKSMWKK